MSQPTLKLVFLHFFLFLTILSFSQNEHYNNNKFRQLYTELPTPNVYRNAAGAPGHEYWQQQADYNINLTLDDETQKIYGEEIITYYNNSPDPLSYLWIQLDQNVRGVEAESFTAMPNEIEDEMSARDIRFLENTFDGGFKIEHVRDINGKDLSIHTVHTMMRIDLSEPLMPSETIQIDIKWWYNINDRMKLGGRSGYEYFPEDDNYLYTIAQFFPRMAVYCDNEGWQNKQFLGDGEFALPFGDYEVNITVPSDHLVAATGELQNINNVLSNQQLQRWEEAKTSMEQTVIIVTEEEAIRNEKTKASDTKTWKFTATNVRDFAFATSRKFIWDAMGVEQSDGSLVMAMSMYPKEGNPLWEQYSTKSVAHTLKWYSHYTFPYPYPVAWSIHTDRIGMEYPMICFNGRRPEEDKTYSEAVKRGLISVIIHEVGHNYFPMIVNSDERQWTWMDEGLNSFLQYLTEQEWERDYPSRRGPPENIVPYMSGDKNNIAPIMTNSESIHQFGNNAYGKPATALNILRETILGRELFDFAFKEYSNRWLFKHPSPADFFRTMEDASSIDLDWFWRGWFFTNENVDIALTDVSLFRLDSEDPDFENKIAKQERSEAPRSIGSIRNEKVIEETQDNIDPAIRDFYTTYDELETNSLDRQEYQEFLEDLSEEEKEMLAAHKNYYQLTFENIGGLVMPIILQFHFTDGSIKDHYIPAEIWRWNHEQVSKVFVLDKEIESIIIDPFLETADTDRSNNYFPSKPQPSRFELFRKGQEEDNPMQRARRAEEIDRN